MKKITTFRLGATTLLLAAAASLTNCGKNGGEILGNLISPDITLSFHYEKRDIEINADFDDANKNDVFIDLNANFKKDPGEELLRGTHTYQTKSVLVSVFGGVKSIALRSDDLKKVNVKNRYVQQLDFSNCENLREFEITNAQSLERINLKRCPISTFTLPERELQIAELSYIDMSNAYNKYEKLPDLIARLPKHNGSKARLLLPAEVAKNITTEQLKTLSDKNWRIIN